MSKLTIKLTPSQEQIANKGFEIWFTRRVRVHPHVNEIMADPSRLDILKRITRRVFYRELAETS